MVAGYPVRAMYIPPSWAIALGAAVLLALAVLVAMRGGREAWWAARVAYLLGGGISGFLAIAFPLALPPLVYVFAILVGMAWRDRRLGDIGVMLIGVGGAIVALLGWNLLIDLSDPAVYGAPDTIGWFLGGAAVLVVGLALLIALASARPPH
jgi:hypothetical protein